MANWWNWINDGWRGLRALLEASTCLGCERELTVQEHLVCLDCLSQLEHTGHEKHFAANEMYRRFGGKIPLQGAGALFYFVKEGRIQQLLHQLKYHNQPGIGREMGRWLGEALHQQGCLAGVDAIIPVPLHRSKERTRGYNQAGHIGRGVQQATGIPVREDILLRLRKTETQAKQHALGRWENVKEAFVVRHQPPASVLIVDDVITTGATVEACVRALMACEQPPKEIRIASIAMPR